MPINIFFKNFNLVIGSGRGIVIERYVFDGWMDMRQKEKFFGSVGFLESEAIAGRIEPSLRNSRVYRIHECRPGGETSETPPGTILEVCFDERFVKSGFIDRFFKESGVEVHHADSFRKPVKHLLDFLRFRCK